MKQPTDNEVQGRFNNASFKFGILLAGELLKDSKAKSLMSDVTDIDRMLNARDALRSSDERLAKSLDRPLMKLKASFTRKVEATVRKIDPSKLTARTRKGLGL